jgi:hypothetical protein
MNGAAPSPWPSPSPSPPSWFSDPARWPEVIGLRVALWCAVSAYFLAYTLDHPDEIGASSDWRYFLHHAIAAWRTWTEYGELPAWNPWFCGGIPALGNVQDNAGSPTQVLPVLFGFVPGWRMSHWLLVVVGMEGTWQLARFLRASTWGALMAALVWATSGRFVQLFHDGHLALLGFEFLPWVWLGYGVALRRWRGAILGALAMGMVLLEGGAVATPIIAITLAALFVLLTGWALLRPWLAPARADDPALAWPWWRPLAALALMAALTCGWTAFRLLPVAEAALTTPRVWHGQESYTLKYIFGMLLQPSKEGGFKGMGTSYIGVGTALLAVYGAARHDRRSWGLAVFLLLLLDLAMGYEKGLGLYELVRKLPVVENIRNPFRFTFAMALVIALAGAIGATSLEASLRAGLAARWRGRGAIWAKRAGWAATVLALVVVGYITRDAVRFHKERLTRHARRPLPERFDGPFRQSLGNRRRPEHFVATNLGTLSCFEEQPFPISTALRGDLPAEEYLDDPTAGTVRRTDWTPHRVAVEVVLRKPARLVVNQNAHRGWQTDTGHIVEHRGLVAVALPAGRHQVTLRFSDPLIEAGGWIAVLTLLGMVAGLVVGRRREVAAAVAVG